MKFSFILSVTAVMAMAAAQSADITAEPSLDVNYADPTVDDSISSSISFDYSDVIDHPFNEMPGDEDLDNVDENLDNEMNDGTDFDRKQGYKKSQFIASPSHGYKGHKQLRKNTRGCYRLDSGAVGSLEGSSKARYNDDRCWGKSLFGSSSAPVKRINPIIYPRSLYESEEGYRTLRRSNHSHNGLVAWSRPKFHGHKQRVHGMGCHDMDGSDVNSFQGRYKYKFYADRHCYGRKVLETKGDKSSIRKINPRSVYIYK